MSCLGHGNKLICVLDLFSIVTVMQAHVDASNKGKEKTPATSARYLQLSHRQALDDSGIETKLVTNGAQTL